MLSDYIISVRIQLMDYQEKLYCKGNVILEPKTIHQCVPIPIHVLCYLIGIVNHHCYLFLLPECTFGPEFPEFSVNIIKLSLTGKFEFH